MPEPQAENRSVSTRADDGREPIATFGGYASESQRMNAMNDFLELSLAARKAQEHLLEFKLADVATSTSVDSALAGAARNLTLHLAHTNDRIDRKLLGVFGASEWHSTFSASTQGMERAYDRVALAQFVKISASSPAERGGERIDIMEFAGGSTYPHETNYGSYALSRTFAATDPERVHVTVTDFDDGYTLLVRGGNGSLIAHTIQDVVPELAGALSKVNSDSTKPFVEPTNGVHLIASLGVRDREWLTNLAEKDPSVTSPGSALFLRPSLDGEVERILSGPNVRCVPGIDLLASHHAITSAVTEGEAATSYNLLFARHMHMQTFESNCDIVINLKPLLKPVEASGSVESPNAIILQQDTRPDRNGEPLRYTKNVEQDDAFSTAWNEGVRQASEVLLSEFIIDGGSANLLVTLKRLTPSEEAEHTLSKAIEMSPKNTGLQELQHAWSTIRKNDKILKLPRPG